MVFSHIVMQHSHGKFNENRLRRSSTVIAADEALNSVRPLIDTGIERSNERANPGVDNPVAEGEGQGSPEPEPAASVEPMRTRAASIARFRWLVAYTLQRNRSLVLERKRSLNHNGLYPKQVSVLHVEDDTAIEPQAGSQEDRVSSTTIVSRSMRSEVQNTAAPAPVVALSSPLSASV
jgi:hypothetical protein